MAKVKGIVSLKGTIGGITYYKTKYGDLAREAGGGFNGEAIRTKASMQRVRENGSEFGHCSKTNKLFREAIGAFYEHYKFAGLHGHLMSMFTRLKDLDTISPRGQRQVGIGVQSEAGKSLLRQFNHTPESQLGNFFPYLPLFHADASLLRYAHIDMTKVKFPKGATHLKLRGGVLDMDFTNMTYQRYATEPVLIDQHFGGGTLDLVLDHLPIIEHTGIPILGMRLYQRVGGEIVPLHDEKYVSVNVLGRQF